MLLHIPHSSTYLPVDFKTDCDLDDELFRMTDWYTNELFTHDYADAVVFPFSRLYCDVERFREDKDEPMSEHGMGVVYTNNSYGGILRSVSDDEKEFIKTQVYDYHHKRFTDAVSEQLCIFESVAIVDCHSFSNEQLPHEASSMRPDFCIGTDDFHTPPEMVVELKEHLESKGFNVLLNEPFSGTIVPLRYYKIQDKVRSVMIEVNRSLYMDGKEKGQRFDEIKSTLTEVLDIVRKYEVQN